MIQMNSYYNQLYLPYFLSILRYRKPEKRLKFPLNSKVSDEFGSLKLRKRPRYGGNFMHKMDSPTYPTTHFVNASPNGTLLPLRFK